MQLLSCTASLLVGSGQCNSCNAPPHCLGAVGSGHPAMYCLTAWGQWAVQLLQCTATPQAGGGQWNSCNARAHQLGGRGIPARRRSLPKERTSCNALPHCLGAVGSGPLLCTPTLLKGSRQAVELLKCTALPLGGCGLWNSYNALPHCLGADGSATPAFALPQCTRAVGTGTPAMRCLAARGQRAVQLVQCTATPPGGGGLWNSCYARAHQLGGRGVLPSTRSLPKEPKPCNAQPHCSGAVGRRQRNSCNALPHCRGSVGTATPALHCLTAWGQCAMELL